MKGKHQSAWAGETGLPSPRSSPACAHLGSLPPGPRPGLHSPLFYLVTGGRDPIWSVNQPVNLCVIQNRISGSHVNLKSILGTNVIFLFIREADGLPIWLVHSSDTSDVQHWLCWGWEPGTLQVSLLPGTQRPSDPSHACRFPGPARREGWH